MSPFRRAERATIWRDQTFASGLVGDAQEIPFGVLTVRVRGSEPAFQKFSMLWDTFKTDQCSTIVHTAG